MHLNETMGKPSVVDDWYLCIILDSIFSSIYTVRKIAAAPMAFIVNFVSESSFFMNYLSHNVGLKGRWSISHYWRPKRRFTSSGDWCPQKLLWPCPNYSISFLRQKNERRLNSQNFLLLLLLLDKKSKQVVALGTYDFEAVITTGSVIIYHDKFRFVVMCR